MVGQVYILRAKYDKLALSDVKLIKKGIFVGMILHPDMRAPLANMD